MVCLIQSSLRVNHESDFKQSRLHWMVCSIWFGKFLSVQTGMLFSGGSREEPIRADSELIQNLFRQSAVTLIQK